MNRIIRKYISFITDNFSVKSMSISSYKQIHIALKHGVEFF